MAKDLVGKNYVITGANTGIGRNTALALAGRGARVIVACRSLDKTQPVLDEIKQLGGTAEFVELDLASFESIHKAADELLAKNIPFHALINNAGLAGKRGTTKDGFELTFGTNHLGHYLLTRLLLDRLKTSGHARIVNVSSQSHYDAKGIDFDKLRSPTKTVTGLQEYAVSKLANVLFTKELARKLEGSDVTTYAVHPGVVASDAWRQVPAPFRWLMKKFMISPQQGAHSSLRAATAPELANETGRYYHADGKEKRPAKLADDTVLAQTLWQRSAEWTGLPA
jgi:retinol dehydrogenase 12